ncbi:Enoyl-CoA hydratase [Leucobacter sp. 7(1)]|uniref:enoyl-CoA hydratase/isomerase family protein n=1 Tax=Leucobacter sp. 7(1) TaxID=1255613 RepID=UPI00097EB845|nr:enoyl-CoA hydratase/isomerase family protein [Leucobacter sp. 7(1)]SJN11094.1 Enoyl-CoA hydratase [Leucobacter sp. 7(1)]
MTRAAADQRGFDPTVLFADAAEYPEAGDCVLLDITGETARIELHRPERLNAASAALIWGLAEALHRVRAAHCRVVVLSGAGRAFCAGHDLKAPPLARHSAAARRHLDRLQFVSHALRDPELISVANVHGFAYGAGIELALSCDFVVAERGTLFRFPEVSVGLSVTGGISFYLPQAIGMPRAKELIMLGEPFDAGTALGLGMITRVADGDERAVVADRIAARVLELPHAAMALAKGTIERVFAEDAARAMALEIENGLDTGGAADAERARARFSERP